MNVKEILYRPPPDVLYHYTTQRGLLGIIDDKEIWASHTQYLNDVREFWQAIDIAGEQLAAMKLKGHDDKASLLEEMQEALKYAQGMNVCVCSFSEDGDALSQWRAYGGRASGFAIGFSGGFLRRVSDQLNCWLVRVVYGEDEQRAVIRTLLEDVLAENLQKAEQVPLSPLDEGPQGGNLLAYLNRYAPILKHKSFSAEREWRIISRPLMCGSKGFGYREGASMLIPYFRIPLSSEQQPFGIQKIIVGPTPHPEQSISSVRGLLVKHDLLQKTEVSNSEVPYRNW